MTAETLTAGKVIFTVKLPETFVTARRLLGDEFQESYTYQIDRIDMPKSVQFAARTMYAVYFVDGNRRAYLGELRNGEVRLTMKSAFPAHATRVRVCQRVVAAVVKGNAGKITAAGWSLVA
ncbi:hypothetical protein VT84_30590 [Gemmata sp. SH-PL17]|uniref:hypothetical protein n=1 Tax=Gemmata sp. SH-PL17 TaxID=1630693 RepID=UPI00078BBC6E|nr:hypothetical protein [Gemmata sp. SH-PL17]AMV28781.1 hypothetical protein VT84_30590 [Gemmata sp. SH-PL17]